MIKTVHNSKDDIPEALLEYYEEREGKFFLKIEENTGLKNALDSEKKKNKELREKLQNFDGIDVEQIKAIMSKAQTDEEKQKIASGDIDAVINSRLEKHRKEFEAKLTAETAVKRGLMSRALQAELRSAALKAGVLSPAVDDAVLRGMSVFSVDNDGSIVSLKDGERVIGKDGKTAYSINEWLDEIKPNVPHWFGNNNQGGAASGNKSTGGNAKVINRQQFNSLSSFERVTFAKEGGTVQD